MKKRFILIIIILLLTPYYLYGHDFGGGGLFSVPMGEITKNTHTGYGSLAFINLQLLNNEKILIQFINYSTDLIEDYTYDFNPIYAYYKQFNFIFIEKFNILNTSFMKLFLELGVGGCSGNFNTIYRVDPLFLTGVELNKVIYKKFFICLNIDYFLVIESNLNPVGYGHFLAPSLSIGYRFGGKDEKK